MNGRRFVLVGYIALVVSACIIDERPGPPSVHARFDTTTFVLSAEHPVVTRTLRFRAVPGAMTVQLVETFLAVNGEGGGGPAGANHPDVWVSILDSATGASSDYGNGNGHASVDGWGHSPDCDGIPCDRSWTVIARWLDPKADEEIPLELVATIRAGAKDVVAKGDPPFELEELSIVETPEPLFEGGYAVTRARVTGSARVGPASKPDVRHLVLRVPAVLLAGEPRLPRLGRIFLGTTVTDWSGRPVHLRATLSFADRLPLHTAAPRARWSGCRCAHRARTARSRWT